MLPQNWVLPYLLVILQWSHPCLALVTWVPEYTGFPLINTSPLKISDTSEQANAFLCVEWCFAKHRGGCRVVLFDSESKECKKVYGGIGMGLRQPSKKSLFFGVIRGV